MSDRPIVVRSVEFDAGHRVATHNGKCRSPHGHRYRVEVAVRGDVADDGMVVDFGVLAELLATHVHDPFDHGFIIDAADKTLRDALDRDGWKVALVHGPPTAETLARVISVVLARHLGDLGLTLESVVVWETPKSRAEVKP